MKANMLKLAFATALGLGLSSASAGIITHELTAPAGSTALDWNATLSIPQFNVPSHLGTLEKVTFTLTGNVSGDVQLENFGSAGSKSYSAFATMTLMHPTSLDPIVVVVPTQSGAASLGGNDGVMDFGGPGGAIVTGANASASQAGVLTSGADLALFTGAGTVDLDLSAAGGLSLPSNVFGVYLANGAATVLVAYEYAPVPEPQVYGAVGSLLCGGLIAYRRFKSRNAETAAA
jgi:hypothetical protein